MKKKNFFTKTYIQKQKHKTKIIKQKTKKDVCGKIRTKNKKIKTKLQ